MYFLFSATYFVKSRNISSVQCVDVLCDAFLLFLQTLMQYYFLRSCISLTTKKRKICWKMTLKNAKLWENRQIEKMLATHTTYIFELKGTGFSF
jgi:hypothetical protein